MSNFDLQMQGVYDRLVKIMNIKPVPMLIVRPGTSATYAAYSPKSNMIVVSNLHLLYKEECNYFKDNKLGIRLKLVHVLAHELQHARQFFENKLSITQSGVIQWTDPYYAMNVDDMAPLPYEDYLNLPWEVDANNVATDIITTYNWDEFLTAPHVD